MAWNQLSHIVAALTTLWLLLYPHLLLFSSLHSPFSLFPLHGCCILLYPFQSCLGGDPVALDCGRYELVIWFGLLRTRVSEQPLFVDPSWTQASYGLTVPSWKERSEPTGLAVKLMWHYCVPQFKQVARLSQAKWGQVLIEFQTMSLYPVNHVFHKLCSY